MKISKEEVLSIAKQVKLTLDGQQAEKLAAEFQEILSCFQLSEKIDSEDMDIKSYEEKIPNVMRRDEAQVFEEKEKLFRNIKSMRNSYIQVPKIIE